LQKLPWSPLAPTSAGFGHYSAAIDGARRASGERLVRLARDARPVHAGRSHHAPL